MTVQELCGDVIRGIYDDIPTAPDDLISYLHHQYSRYQQHPCFHEVISEVGNILTSRCSVDEFSRFCGSIDTPEPLIKSVLNTCIDLLGTRDYNRAMSLIKYILPYGELPWPVCRKGEEIRSFRDMVEYMYYMTICEPERKVIIAPYLQTDILFLYGRLLSGNGDYEPALPVLEAAKRQSPVHAGILGALADVMMKTDKLEKAGDIILRSFRCAWMKEDLAYAYRNQGYFFSLHEEYDAAITCFLIAEAWDDSSECRESLKSIAEYLGKGIDPLYYNTHGREILAAHGVPFGPDSDITGLLVMIADDYLEEHNLFKAREYLIRAHQLLMDDQLGERIRWIEWHIEDQVDF